MTLLASEQSRPGIKFRPSNALASYLFEEPELLSFWTPPRTAGLFAILLYDTNWKPEPFRVIYFGQTGNFYKRGLPEGHEKYHDWLREAESPVSGLQGDREPYIAVMRMPSSTRAERRNIESALIDEYKPVCNIQSNSFMHGLLHLVKQVEINT